MKIGVRAGLGEVARQVPRERPCKVPSAEHGDTGEEPAQTAPDEGIELQVIKLPEAKKEVRLPPRRRVVERSFGWLNRFRRFAKDYEWSRTTGSPALRLYSRALHNPQRRAFLIVRESRSDSHQIGAYNRLQNALSGQIPTDGPPRLRLPGPHYRIAIAP